MTRSKYSIVSRAYSPNHPLHWWTHTSKVIGRRCLVLRKRSIRRISIWIRRYWSIRLGIRVCLRGRSLRRWWMMHVDRRWGRWPLMINHSVQLSRGIYSPQVSTRSPTTSPSPYPISTPTPSHHPPRLLWIRSSLIYSNLSMISMCPLLGILVAWFMIRWWVGWRRLSKSIKYGWVWSRWSYLSTRSIFSKYYSIRSNVKLNLLKNCCISFLTALLRKNKLKLKRNWPGKARGISNNLLMNTDSWTIFFSIFHLYSDDFLIFFSVQLNLFCISTSLIQMSTYLL